jgi:choline kinase
MAASLDSAIGRPTPKGTHLSDTPTLKAVVLAAGTSQRLRPLTDNKPKALLTIDGVPLLHRLAVQCANIGVTEFIVVTGHCHDKVATWATETNLPLPVTTLFAPEYDTTNNAVSLLATRDRVEGHAFLKFDGDLILHGDILKRLMASNAPSALVLDTTKELVEEDMRVITHDNGHVAAIGKHLELARSKGVSIGVERFSAADGAVVFDAIDGMVRGEGRVGAWYEDAYHTLVGNGFDLQCVDTDGLPWTEIDTLDDLKYAEQLAKTLDPIVSGPDGRNQWASANGSTASEPPTRAQT